MKGTNLFKLPEQRAIFHSDAATGVSQKHATRWQRNSIQHPRPQTVQKSQLNDGRTKP